ncbi:MAG: DMT family transporter [Desulfobacteraceae bacterium]|jgi:drug/metabolite transporter (DMT)-like permease
MDKTSTKVYEPYRQYWAEFILVTVTIFWGGTFPLVKDAIEEIPVMAFLWIRFALAAAILLVWAGWSQVRSLGKSGWFRGLWLGVLLFASYAFQTFGLALTSSANAAFVTGLNVVWVPLLAGPLLSKPPAAGSRIGVVCALIGLFMLTYQAPWRLNPGDALVLVCSLFVAFHVLGLDAWTHGYDGRALAFVQIGTMAVLSLAGSLMFEPVTWPRVWTPKVYWAIIICSLFATVYAFWAMTVFQKMTTPTRAALIYTLEPVFGAMVAVLYAGERLTGIAWTGGVLIVIGMIVAEIWPLLGSRRQ